MKKKYKFLFVISIFIFAFVILLQGLNNNNFYQPNKIINQKISNFSSLELFSNKKVFFEDILKNNEYTILNIWSSWCLPCRDEHKYMMKISNFSNVNLVGLNYKDKKINAKKFIKDFSNPYNIILIDRDGTKAIELGAYGVPETYIIKNSNKKIIKKYIGPISQKKLNEIKKILNDKNS